MPGLSLLLVLGSAGPAMSLVDGCSLAERSVEVWEVQPKVLGDLQHSGTVYLRLGAWEPG